MADEAGPSTPWVHLYVEHHMVLDPDVEATVEVPEAAVYHLMPGQSLRMTKVTNSGMMTTTVTLAAIGWDEAGRSDEQE